MYNFLEKIFGFCRFFASALLAVKSESFSSCFRFVVVLACVLEVAVGASVLEVAVGAS